MTTAEALNAVRQHGLAGRFVISHHAYLRMRQRNVLVRDIRSALTAASTCLPDGEKWRVTGPDYDGDPLTCIVLLDDGVLVVTVF
jgi:hypothetical protein